MAKELTFLGSIESHSFSDFHFFKDVLLVPLMLGASIDYHVTIVCHNLNEDLMHTYFPSATFEAIPLENYTLHLLNYVQSHAREIDLVFAFGPYTSYQLILQAYKALNPSGKVYMKLDVNRYWLQYLLQYSSTTELFALCDLISSESELIASIISDVYSKPIYYLPNGYSTFFPSRAVSFSEKENVILTVGRLGDPCKQTHILIEAFLKAHLPDWQFRLIGPIDPSFEPQLDIYRQIPYFNEHVIFTGSIHNKHVLEAEYAKAKIFCLSSKLECCAHVYAEAAKYGCYIISSDVDGVSDLTLKEHYSKIIPINSVESFANAFTHVTSNTQVLEDCCIYFQAYARTYLSWEYLISKLADQINALL